MNDQLISELKFAFFKLSESSSATATAMETGINDIWLPDLSDVLHEKYAVANALTRLYLLPKEATEPRWGIIAVSPAVLEKVADFNKAKRDFKKALLAIKRSDSVNKSISRQVKSWIRYHPDKAFRTFLKKVSLHQMDTTACYRQIKVIDEAPLLTAHFLVESNHRGVCKNSGGLSAYQVAIKQAQESQDQQIADITRRTLSNLSMKQRQQLRLINTASARRVVNLKFGDSEDFYWKSVALSGVFLCESMPHTITIQDPHDSVRKERSDKLKHVEIIKALNLYHVQSRLENS